MSAWRSAVLRVSQCQIQKAAHSKDIVETSIGRGLAAGNVFCALLDLLSPQQKFEPYNKILCKGVEECANKSMILATNEAVADNLDEEMPSTEKYVTSMK
ncbi:hypothetical protein J6590_040673 [Homalodisca vitripennis]|nr:hypothetical protein J6590_079329 [Homalodisca vitripennis]KAG8267891.1 hypothetical protein J6590_040673 [Homalodisca vitripennis]